MILPGFKPVSKIEEHTEEDNIFENTLNELLKLEEGLAPRSEDDFEM